MQDMRLFHEVLEEHPEFETEMQAMFGMLQEGESYVQLVFDEITRLRGALKALARTVEALQGEITTLQWQLKAAQENGGQIISPGTARYEAELAEGFRRRAEWAMSLVIRLNGQGYLNPQEMTDLERELIAHHGALELA
jgi:hypothetical protein